MKLKYNVLFIFLKNKKINKKIISILYFTNVLIIIYYLYIFRNKIKMEI